MILYIAIRILLPCDYLHDIYYNFQRQWELFPRNVIKKNNEMIKEKKENKETKKKKRAMDFFPE